jgi:hypothetical protein
MVYPEDLPDNECFFRENAICLRKHRNDELDEDMAELLQLTGPSDANDYFIFCSRPVDKEDWFFALCSASRLRSDQSPKQRDAALVDPCTLNSRP